MTNKEHGNFVELEFPWYEAPTLLLPPIVDETVLDPIPMPIKIIKVRET